MIVDMGGEHRRARLRENHPFGEVYGHRLDAVMGQHTYGPELVVASDLLAVGCYFLREKPDLGEKLMRTALLKLGFDIGDVWTIIERARERPADLAEAFPCHGEVLDWLFGEATA